MKNRCLFTDLDGSLLNSENNISNKDFFALKLFMKKGFFIIPITGRNLFSAKKVLKKDFPFDYLVFSNGAGIYKAKTEKIIFEKSFNSLLTQNLTLFLLQMNVNFFIQFPIPENHKFFYYQAYEEKDFLNRLNLYKNFAIPLNINKIPQKSTQFIIILETNENRFNCLKEKILKHFQVQIIRSTSPLNHKNIWLEIFPKDVSKAQTAKILCKKLNSDISEAIALGNDYNDKDLLDLVGYPFVVKNAHLPENERYITVNTNNKNPLFSVWIYCKNNLDSI